VFQRFEYLTRERTKSPEAADNFDEELNILLAKWDEIRENKMRLAEEHEHLETAIEELIADKERLTEEHQQLYDV
jgi:flagellar biosynthesis/type III secretory pathway chaperone